MSTNISDIFIALKTATDRLAILSYELKAMEAELDNQIDAYKGRVEWDIELSLEIERADIKTAALMGETVREYDARHFKQLQTELLHKRQVVECANNVVRSYEVDIDQYYWDKGELVLWHHNGYHYLRNKNNHVYWQKSGLWAGVYKEDCDFIDTAVVEPQQPSPRVSVNYVEWKCDKTTNCHCNF